MIAEAMERLDGLVEKARAVGVTVTPFVREGDAARQILEVAHATKSDVIIMGSRGRVGLRRHLFGSVARNVAMRADCPVFIIKS